MWETPCTACVCKCERKSHVLCRQKGLHRWCCDDAGDVRDAARSLGREDALEEGTAHASILACRSPWPEEPGRLQSTGSQRVRHEGSNLARMQGQKSRAEYHCHDKYQSTTGIQKQ